MRDRRKKEGFLTLLGRLLALPMLLYRVHAFLVDAGPRYVPGGKSKLMVWFDLVRWGLKHGEVNEFYFLYGFNRLGWSAQDEYISYRVLRHHRDWGNGSYRSEGVGLNYKCLIRDKFVFGQLAASLGISSPVALGLIENDVVAFLDESHRRLRCGDLLELVSFFGSDFWVKSVLGACAQSVWHIQSCDGLFFVNGENVRSFTCPDSSAKHLVQLGVRQHPALSELYPHAVNTIRLVTIRTDSGVEVFSVLLRVGANRNHSDNWAIGGLVGGVDIMSGRTRGRFYYKPSYGLSVDIHPDTKAKLDGIEIPFFAKTVELAKLFHGYFYGLKSIGWDVAITSAGPVFIEANDDWEVALHQVVDGGLKLRFSHLHGELN